MRFVRCCAAAIITSGLAISSHPAEMMLAVPQLVKAKVLKVLRQFEIRAAR